jgi:hypothetical protein
MADFDLGGLADKAKEFLDSDQVKDALKSEQAEDISDKVLDGVEDVVNKVTGGKFEQQVEDARDNVDKAIGTE